MNLGKIDNLGNVGFEWLGTQKSEKSVERWRRCASLIHLAHLQKQLKNWAFLPKVRKMRKVRNASGDQMTNLVIWSVLCGELLAPFGRFLHVSPCK